MNKKTARKWQKVTKQKNVEINTTAFLIKTHERSQSQAQILVSAKYKQFSKPESILLIESPNKQFTIYVQAAKQSLRSDGLTGEQNEKCEISVLKNVADLYGVVYGDNGMFRGEIRVVSQKQVLPQKQLQYAQILIRNNYFSRRDQYKVSQLLKQRVTHVHARKVIYFESTKIEVTNMMKSNQQILKTGFITKNTKLIFRSACSKTAILVQLSKETFDLNSTRELYLDRMIQFLIVYFSRNLYFNNKHRVEIILYARLFYPQFKTLTDAYNHLMKQATLGSSQNKFEINYAVSLQKDYKGRIYQDAYRKVIWQSSQLSTFKKYFLQKVSQFLFTLNWQYNKSKHSQFISKSINSKVTNEFQCVQIPQTWKIKPFIHRMKCQLSDSYNSNLFEAICLVSEQYKHHYKFRALDETGNAIIVLSAGRSEYETDLTTYKMAKSYIYLTNISCMMVNMNKKVEKVKVHVYDFPKHLFKQESDIRKLQKLMHWCIEQLVYQSPINQRIRFNSHKAGFQMKSFIFPQDIMPITEKSQLFRHFGKQKCHCSSRKGKNTLHYYLNQSYQQQLFQHKNKQIDWICSYFINNEALKIHQKFYDRFYQKVNYQGDFYQPHSPNIHMQGLQYRDLSYAFLNELNIFEEDLEKIIIKKENWFGVGPMKNQLNMKVDKYLHHQAGVKRRAGNQQELRSQLNSLLEKTNRKMFEIQATRKEQNNVDFQLSSCEDALDRSRNRLDDFYDSKIRSRKNSKCINDNFGLQQEMEIIKPKINIFQQTLRNKEYNIASMNKEKSRKFLSHNKQRLRANYKESNIHYMMSYFAEHNLRKLNKFIRKQFYESLSQQQIKINDSFQYEKQWKSLCFPILTPISTKYRQDFKEIEIILDSTQTGDDKTLQNDACRLLMQNYQLSQVNASKTIMKFSKGYIIKTLQKIDNTISKTYTIDKLKQQSLVPFLLYRYLLYEEKDYRFCSKTIYFQNKNYYDKEKKDSIETETKALKLLFLYDPCDDCRDSVISYNPMASVSNLLNGQYKKSPIQQFKRLFKEKFHQQMVVVEKKQPCSSTMLSISTTFGEKREDKGNGSSPDKSIKSLGNKNLKDNPKKSFGLFDFGHEKEKQTINNEHSKIRQMTFSLGNPGNKKYNSEQIRVIHDSEFSQKNLFKIIIQWDHCSSILVNEFVQNVITIGRRSKLNSFRTTTQDVFSIEWNMNVVGEIVFSNQLAVQMLEYSVIRNDDWYYDTMGFYMDWKGIAFIKFQKEKKLVLWKDNNYEKKVRQPELYNEEYNKFFMLSAAFDFLGEMIEQAYQIFSRKHTQVTYDVKQSFAVDEYSIQGSYNSDDAVTISPVKKK